MMSKTAAIRTWTLILLAASGCSANTGAGEIVPFDSERWTIEATEHRVEDHLGRPSLFLKGGVARLDDVEFIDGIIEFDIAFTPERGFPGMFWRLQDDRNFEELYFRPHQNGNPDANQYTPIFNGLPGWQLYHGEGYGVPIEYRFGEWMHVKLVVSQERAEAYLDSDEPFLVIDDLKRDPIAGKIGVEVSDYAPAWFSNFHYEQLSAPPLQTDPRPRQPTPPGTVTRWAVSNPFAEAALEGRTRLTASALPDLEWSALASEPTGITNLARLAGISEEANTVMARVIVRSDRERIVRAGFGYSDRVRVYLNDRLMYSGDNGYRTRDYRYLGTIGLFDEVWLPLQRGDNELWFAVSEDFGGWGILCRLGALEGIDLVIP
jgi:hypothetical protein